jgi:HK97 family phage major capsid protein
VDDKSKDDETPKAGSELKDLIESVRELTQVKIAEASKPAEPGPTDIKTRPDFSAAPESPQSDDKDERFTAYKQTKAIDPTSQLPTAVNRTGGFLPHRLDSLSEDEKKTINVLDFPLGDYDNFSMARYAMAAQRAHYLGGSPSKDAPWETKYYEAGKKIRVYDPVLKAAQGDMVSGQDGGFLAPEFWSTNFLDQLYAAQVVTQLPITQLRMGTRVVHMPKLTTAISISYAAENATLATTVAQFSQLSFTARKQGQIIQISNELIRDAVPAADSILQNHAIKWMALDRDIQLIKGNGQAGAPVGLVNASNFTALANLGSAGAPTYPELNTAIYNVENLNGSTNVPFGQTQCTGFFGPVIAKKEILNIVDSNGRPLYDFQGMNAIRGAFPNSGGGAFDGLLGVPTWRFSNILNESASNHTGIFGDWQWLYYMQRQDVEIMVSNVAGTSFASDQTWIRLISRYDVGVAHPEAFYGYKQF